MRVAVLADIHGNLPALEAVLAELDREPPDAVLIGGDVAAGPMPVEVLRALRALPWPVHWVRGNADRGLREVADGTLAPELREHPIWVADAWTAERMDRADVDFVAGLPPVARLGVDGLGEVLFVHGSFRSDEERLTTATPDGRLAAILAAGGAAVTVGGHTHRQYDRTAGGRRMINAGSVGRPYERAPGAYWARLGPGVELRRTAYDTQAAAARFRALGYPGADTMLAPVDPDEVARAFEPEPGAPPPDPAGPSGTGLG
jgi:predicted phosphodiesterase